MNHNGRPPLGPWGPTPLELPLAPRATSPPSLAAQDPSSIFPLAQKRTLVPSHFRLVLGGLALATLGAIALAMYAPDHPYSAAVTGLISLVLLSIPALAARGLLLAPLFTRLTPDTLLQHNLRTKILDLLRVQPGLGITDVCSQLGIGWGTAVHHLTRLEQARLVVSQDAGRRRRFFLPNESLTVRTAISVLSTDLNRRLLEHIRAHPGTSQQETCAALGISAPLAHKYLARLQAEGLVTSARQWRTVQYYAADSVAAHLDEYARLTGTKGPLGPSNP